jgi:hypothetical protein
MDIANRHTDFRHAVHVALQDKVFKRKLKALREKSYVTLGTAIFDAKHRRSNPFDCNVDVWRFNNFHLSAVRLTQAVTLTLMYWRGERMWMEFLEGRGEGVDGMVRRWMEIEPGDNEEWVRLLFKVLEFVSNAMRRSVVVIARKRSA